MCWERSCIDVQPFGRYPPTTSAASSPKALLRPSSLPAQRLWLCLSRSRCQPYRPRNSALHPSTSSPHAPSLASVGTRHRHISQPSRPHFILAACGRRGIGPRRRARLDGARRVPAPLRPRRVDVLSARLLAVVLRLAPNLVARLREAQGGNGGPVLAK
jgi:hypothetical protein